MMIVQITFQNDPTYGFKHPKKTPMVAKEPSCITSLYFLCLLKHLLRPGHSKKRIVHAGTFAFNMRIHCNIIYMLMLPKFDENVLKTNIDMLKPANKI